MDYNYDPYFDYNQQMYGGYDDYNAYNPTPPPLDPNWVNPVHVNRAYLKKIQKSCVLKGFEGLKEERLFLLEVLIKSVVLKKAMIPVQNEEPLKFYTHVKFMSFPFIEVNGEEPVSEDDSIRKSKNSITNNANIAFSNLFQEVFTTPNHHDSIIVSGPGAEEEETTEPSDSQKHGGEKPVLTEDVESFTVMKGKSLLIPMTGLTFIQNLQQHPLIVKVNQRDGTDELALCSSSFRVPETCQRAVLLSCKEDSVLPFVSTDDLILSLRDAGGEEVGSLEVTVTLSSLGKGVANCTTENNYEHTMFLKNLKTKQEVVADNVNPRLAKEIMQMGLFYPIEKSSSQVLKDCALYNSDKGPSSENCQWFDMLRQARPAPPQRSCSLQEIMESLEREKAELWMRLRQICRDPERTTVLPRTSLDDRLKELQTLRGSSPSESLSLPSNVEFPQIQTGVAELETKNPFEDQNGESESRSSAKQKRPKNKKHRKS